MTRKRVVKDHLLQIIAVTTQVAILRRVSRFKPEIRDRQGEKGAEEGG